MRQWYCHDGGQQKGPIPESELTSMLASGSMSAETLVWTESMNEWQQARTIEGLVPSAYFPPTLAQSIVSPHISAFVPSEPQVRPWVRFWARTTDGLLFGAFVAFILMFIAPAILEMNDILFGMIIAFVFVFVEPLLLSTWGTTPGKALFNIRLRRSDGNKPGYNKALSRAFNVWMRGEGFGIPFVELLTRINAYNKLTKEGITSWDRDGGFTVSHGSIGTGRIFVAIAIFIGFIILMTVRQMD